MQRRDRPFHPLSLPAASRELLNDAAAWRHVLAAQWLSAVDVNAGLGLSADSQDAGASQMRRRGHLLGVFVAQPPPSYRYPTWQFRSDGRPVEHLTEILSVLRDHGPFDREPGGMRRTTGWGEVEWFLCPHALLDGLSPAVALCSDPASVLRAALTEFTTDA